MKILSDLELGRNPLFDVGPLAYKESPTFWEELATAEIALMSLVSFLPEAAPKLKWIQITGTGVDTFLDHPLLKSDVLITNASGVSAPPLAGHILGSMLYFSKRFPELQRLRKTRGWPNRELSGDELEGKTVGILGYGSIGREVGRLCQACKMRILAIKRNPAERLDQEFCLPGYGDPKGLIPEWIYGPEDLGKVMTQSDFFVISMPLTPENKGMVGKRELSLLKPSAYLINVARGAIVDEDVLLDMLKNRRMGGAALDVFVQEPLPPKSEFWEMDNVLLSPHNSVATPYYMERLLDLFCMNLRRYVKGQPLLNLVDRERGY